MGWLTQRQQLLQSSRGAKLIRRTTKGAHPLCYAKYSTVLYCSLQYCTILYTVLHWVYSIVKVSVKRGVAAFWRAAPNDFAAL